MIYLFKSDPLNIIDIIVTKCKKKQEKRTPKICYEDYKLRITK